LKKAQAYEALEELENAFNDYQLVLSLGPSIIASKGSQRVKKGLNCFHF